MASRRVTIEFLGDDKSLSKTARSVDTTTSKLGDTFKRVGKTAAVGLGVGIAAAGTALVAFGKGAVEEAREAQKVAAQTEAVIKSTGGAANVTAGQVADLAEKLSLKAGIDDELIQSGSNVLLTFKNIRNEVGKGNDIFNQATGIALDMSVALGQDMKSASILVGKALNDPVAGLSALSRVGVSFTEKQKKVIEGLVKSGDTMKAQKLILRELNSEFAGSAEAQATAGEKARVAWGNFQEEIGAKLLPLMDKLAVFFVEVIVPALQRFAAWFQREGVPVIKRFARTVEEVFQRVVAWVRQNWPEIRKTIQEVLDTIVTNWRNFAAIVVRIWTKWGDDIFRVLEPILKGIIEQIRNVMKIIRGVINVVTGLIKGDWGQVWRGIKEIFGGVWGSMKTQLKTSLKVFAALIKSGWDAVKDIFKNAWDGIKDLVRRAWEGIKDLIKKYLELVRDIFMFYVKIYREIFSRVWDAIKTVTKRVWDAIRDFLANVVDNIRDRVGDVFDAMRDRIGNIWEGVRDKIGNVWEGIKNIFERVIDFVRDTVPNAFDRGVDKIKRFWERLERIAKAPINFIIKWVYTRGIKAVVDAIPGVPDLPPIKELRTGGWTGPGGEHQPAGIVHADEFVIRKRARKKLEASRPGLLDRLNETGAWPGYAIGGRVAGALRWARGQDYQPYLWGGMGFGGWDCSGFMSGVTNFLRGNPIHSRVGSTASFPWPGFKPGVGLFTIGSTPNYGGSGVGHMAGTLAGVNVESRGGDGVVIGRAARGYNDPHFTQIYHLGPGGIGSGLGTALDFGAFSAALGSIASGAMGAFDAVPDFLNKLGEIKEDIESMLSKGGWWPMLGKSITSLIPAFKDWVLDQIKSAGGWMRDKSADVFGDLSSNAHDAWESINDIPGLKNGGIVTRPTLAMVGEAGPEAVIPLRRRRPMTAGDVLVAEIHVYLDSRKVHESLVKLKRQNGGVPLGLS